MGIELDLQENGLMLNNNIEEKQNNFLVSTLSDIVNTAVDVGIKVLLPDMIEDQVIEIKNTILESGFKEGVNKAIESAIDFGKSTLGILTGKFENTQQVETAIKKGGIIDTISDLLENSIKQAQKDEKINKETAKQIIAGKDKILDNIADRIEDTMKTQIKNVEKLEEYSLKWKDAYEARDFNTMDKRFKNLEKYLEKTIPLENIINEARQIENLHNLIKNNGKNFELSPEELKLAEKL